MSFLPCLESWPAFQFGPIWFKSLFEFSLSSFHRLFPRSSLLLTSNELHWLRSTIKQGDAATSWSQNVIMASTSSQSGSRWVSRQPGVCWPSTMNEQRPDRYAKVPKYFLFQGIFVLHSKRCSAIIWAIRFQNCNIIRDKTKLTLNI